MDSLQALDAVISGYAYENATAAIGIIEEGGNTGKQITTEMLCTLDNFIKVVLFNEHIFLTGSADLIGNLFVPRKPRYAANKSRRHLFDEAHIFFPEQQFEGDLNAVEDRVTRTLQPVNLQEYPLFVIQCTFPKKKLTLLQEMIYLDAYFIEYAIEQYGAERFKPVFPGEHLYLGLRRERVAVPHATHTMADILGHRLRAIVRERMEKLNVFVPQGAPRLPGLPPIFASRILHECSNGSDFVPTLLKIRNSPAMKSFRQWMAGCHELSRSMDVAERQKAADAFEKLNRFSPEDDLSATDFGITLLDTAIDIAKADPVAIVTEMISPIVKYFGGVPFSGLQQFSEKIAAPEKLKNFFKGNFGEQFSRHEMDFISTLITLPDNLTDWSQEETAFTIYGVHLNPEASPLARPCFQRVEDAAYAKNALTDFDELFSGKAGM